MSTMNSELPLPLEVDIEISVQQRMGSHPVRERGCERPRWGRPWCLALADRLLLLAVYYRTNLTKLAPLFGVSPATVCRVE
jgi:hypothetical protein